MCVHCRFAFPNWKFLQFQWARVYSFNLLTFPSWITSRNVPSGSYELSASSANKWVHSFFSLLPLSLKLQCPRIIRLTKRWDLLLYSKSTKVIPKKENSAQTQWHRLPSRFVSAVCLPSVGSALPIVRSAGWLWRQVSVLVFRTNKARCQRAKTWDYPASAVFADFSLFHNVSKLPTRTKACLP